MGNVGHCSDEGTVTCNT